MPLLGPSTSYVPAVVCVATIQRAVLLVHSPMELVPPVRSGYMEELMGETAASTLPHRLRERRRQGRGTFALASHTPRTSIRMSGARAFLSLMIIAYIRQGKLEVKGDKCKLVPSSAMGECWQTYSSRVSHLFHLPAMCQNQLTLKAVNENPGM